MATTTVSIAIDEAELREARICAQRDGISLSLWMTRAALGKRMTDNGKRYRAAVEAETGEDLELTREWEEITRANIESWPAYDDDDATEVTDGEVTTGAGQDRA